MVLREAQHDVLDAKGEVTSLMQTLIFILILFLISVFSILLYFKNKHSRVDKLNRGECPSCKAKAKVFFDEVNHTQFTQEVITKNVLKSHGCCGVYDIEYRCKECGLKEVYSQV